MKRPRISLRGSLEGFAEKRGISTRLLILFIVLFVVAVTLAPPTNTILLSAPRSARCKQMLSPTGRNLKKLEQSYNVGVILSM